MSSVRSRHNWVQACCLSAAIAALTTLAAVRASAEPPARTPVERSAPADAIEASFAGLADADAVVREASRLKLMSMSRDDLPRLRAVVEAALPLDPAQDVVLKEIVGQVFLADEPYPGDTASGFMGINMSQAPVAVGDQPTSGIVVVGRIQGFSAYSVLAAGDVILGLGVNRPEPVQAMAELIDRVRLLKPGTELKLRVLRGGQEMDVTLRLNRRPAAADANDLVEYDQFIGDRQEKFERYWKDQFSSLLKPVVS